MFYVVFQYSVPSCAFNTFPISLTFSTTNENNKNPAVFFIIFSNKIPSFFLVCYFPAHIQAPITHLLTSTTHHSIYKVNRCLARYSPRATTTNRLTNRAPNKPAWPGPN